MNNKQEPEDADLEFVENLIFPISKKIYSKLNFYLFKYIISHLY